MSAGGITSCMIRSGNAELYTEVRGTGPPVLLVPPACGDAGIFDYLAERLARRFTVVTYDRRSNSRSLRPAGWKSTSVEEQADDAAAVLQAIVEAPAAVYGSSAGGTIALDIGLRHPSLIRSVSAHEPVLIGMLPLEERRTFSRVGKGRDPTWDLLPADVKRRIHGNVHTRFFYEMDAFVRYEPADTLLQDLTVPTHLLYGTNGSGRHRDILFRMAPRFPTASLHEVPGRHTPYLDDPDIAAEVLARFFA